MFRYPYKASISTPSFFLTLRLPLTDSTVLRALGEFDFIGPKYLFTGNIYFIKHVSFKMTQINIINMVNNKSSSCKLRYNNLLSINYITSIIDN